MSMPFTPPGPEDKVFVISVAAELSGLHPQTLRTYDRIGLVAAGRTSGGGRRYSVRDIELLRLVAQLTSEGLGLEGVRRVIELQHQVELLRARVGELEAELVRAHSTQNLPALWNSSEITLYRRRR